MKKWFLRDKHPVENDEFDSPKMEKLIHERRQEIAESKRNMKEVMKQVRVAEKHYKQKCKDIMKGK